MPGLLDTFKQKATAVRDYLYPPAPNGMTIWDYAQQRANDPLQPNLSSRMMQQDLINNGLNIAGMAPVGMVGRAKTQYEIAHDIASKNAEKMLGLPKGNTAAQRMKALNFNEKGLTGTNRDISSYDPSKAGASGSGSREGPLGAWLTDDPRVAGEFANWSSRGLGGDVVYPLMIRGGKPYEAKAYSDIKDIVDANTAFKRPPYRMVQDEIDYDAAKKQLIGMGDYLVLRNTNTDSIDKPITQYLVSEPNRLRSIFAAFDPARVNESDLLAGLAPYLGVGGLLGLGMYDNQGRMPE
jgi:hypothetical protein